MAEREFLRLPVVSLGAEYLVMGYLMRRNILAYKAPPNNEGYDLICIHPDPRHHQKEGESDRVRVQVKSRYASDCNRRFPVRGKSFDAFDYVIAVFLNIGNFFGKKECGPEGYKPEFYTLPSKFAREHQDPKSKWGLVKLRGLEEELEQYKNECGFEQIAKALGIPKPSRPEKKQA